MWVFLPGLLVELLGILILVAGIAKDSSAAIVLGICVLVIAIAIHILLISRRIRRGVSLVPIQPAQSGSMGSATGPQVLYSDGLVLITGDSITFRNYSLFLKPRTVSFSDVDHIDVKRARTGTGKYRIWGSGNFCTWFPLDSGRPSRDRIFHLTLKTRGMNIGFSVENSPEVTRILKNMGLIGSEEPII